MGTFVNAFNQGAIQRSNGNITVECTYDLGDGNHDVQISGSKTNVHTGDGESTIVHYGSDATITSGSGYTKITSIGDNKTIITDSGDDDITFIGENCTVNAGDGDNNVTFWGNGANIKTGSGDDNIKTFDQIYEEGDYSDLTQAFIATLPTGVWEDWNKVSRHLIDYKCKKSLMSKTRIWTYEDTYDVETFFSRYINGLKDVTIDMGSGSNTANVTVDKKTATIINNGKNVLTKDLQGNITCNDKDVKINDDWQLDYSLGKRKETIIDQKVKTNSRAGGIFVAAAAAVAAVVLTVVTCGTAGPACAAAFGSLASTCGASAAVAGAAAAVGTAVGTVATVAGAASMGLSIANAGYNVATGQAHSGDWVNLASSALACMGAPALAAGLKGVYSASEGDYLDATMNIATAGLAVGNSAKVDCIKDSTGALTTTGKVLNTVKVAASAANVIDKTIDVVDGDADIMDIVSLTAGVGNLCSASLDLTGTKVKGNTSKVEETPKPEATNSNSDSNIVSNIVDYLGDEMFNAVSAPGRLFNQGTSYLGEKIGDNWAGNAIKGTGNVVGGVFTAAGNIANNTVDIVAHPIDKPTAIYNQFMQGSGFGKSETTPSTETTTNKTAITDKNTTNKVVAKTESTSATQKPTTQTTEKSFLDKVGDKVESGIDIAGDVAGGILSVPGQIIAGTTSVIGNNFLGTDNWLGNGAVWVGDNLNSGLSWAGNKLDSGIDTAGGYVAHPIDTATNIAKKAGEKLGITDSKETTATNTKPKADSTGAATTDTTTDSNWLSTGIEKGTSFVGKLVGGAIKLPGEIISGVGSYIGEDVMGPDTKVGSAIATGSKKIDGAFNWAGNGAQSAVQTTGSAVAHPVDTYNKAMSSLENIVDPAIDDDVIIEHNFDMPDDTAYYRKIAQDFNKIHRAS